RPGEAITALDVGCGWGISEDRVAGPALLADIRANADVLVGVEPDPAVRPAHGLFTTLLHASMEEAPLAAASVDVAYAYYVLEHVAHPEAFLRAVARVLRPGGIFVAMTPNARHWFGRVARLMHRLRADGSLLALLRGRATVASYHYPAVHRMNDAALLRALGARTGLGQVTCTTHDHGDVQPYLPRLVRPLYTAWSRRVEGRPGYERVCLLVRMERDDAPAPASSAPPR
ncbi:MAG: methyltransferase domain-containing protein, partial [Gemmatimonadetes bacterium]|nr:methyltransferase domain-containing protein [Gemmatimonadota bacterium]